MKQQNVIEKDKVLPQSMGMGGTSSQENEEEMETDCTEPLCKFKEVYTTIDRQ